MTARGANAASFSNEEKPPEISFLRLESAASNAQLQQYYEGKLVRMSGRFSGNEKVFTLLRYKMNCCAADAIPFTVTVRAPRLDKRFKLNQWVAVSGRLRDSGGQPLDACSDACHPDKRDHGNDPQAAHTLPH